MPYPSRGLKTEVAESLSNPETKKILESHTSQEYSARKTHSFIDPVCKDSFPAKNTA